jgi:hypothetical protein
MLELEELTIKNEIEIYNQEDECIGKLGASKREIWDVDYKRVKYNQLTYHIVICSNVSGCVSCPTTVANESVLRTVNNDLKNDGYDGTLYYSKVLRGCDDNEDAENRVYEVSVYKKILKNQTK